MSKPSFSLFISLLLITILATLTFGQTRVGKLGVGVEGSTQFIIGAGSVTSSAGFGGGIDVNYSLLEGMSLRSKFVINQLVWKDTLSRTAKTDLVSLNMYLSGDLMPNSKFNIFIFGGGGLVFYDPKKPDGNRYPTSSFDINYIGGLGADFFPNEFWSITLMGEYVMTNSPYYNGPADSANDSYIRASLQIRYYFFDELFVSKLLDTQRDRIKRR